MAKITFKKPEILYRNFALTNLVYNRHVREYGIIITLFPELNTAEVFVVSNLPKKDVSPKDLSKRWNLTDLEPYNGEITIKN